MKQEKLIPIVIISLFVLGASYILFFKKGASRIVDQEAADAVNMHHTASQAGSELLDAAGEPVNFADFKGKVVFVNNWASWCPPCVAEMPTIENLKASFKGEDLAFVMVSFDQEPEVFKIIFLDRAGYHLTKTLQVPDNIHLLYLPSSNPDRTADAFKSHRAILARSGTDAHEKTGSFQKLLR